MALELLQLGDVILELSRHLDAVPGPKPCIESALHAFPLTGLKKRELGRSDKGRISSTASARTTSGNAEVRCAPRG